MWPIIKDWHYLKIIDQEWILKNNQGHISWAWPYWPFNTVCIASQLIVIKLSVSDTGVNGGSHYLTDILADNTSSLESAKTKESL